MSKFENTKGVKIIDNGNGSKSALIEVGGGRYKRLANRDLAVGETMNRTNASFDIWDFARKSSYRSSSYPITCGDEEIVKRKIVKTLYYWENEPIVYKCIDLLTKLANDSFTISSEAFIISSYILSSI